MPRYFIELAYRGTAFSGFQVQENANTIQAELEKALFTYFRRPFELTGSSRTDTGVHALQNFFHVDSEESFPMDPRYIYNINAILPPDIVVKTIREVATTKHCRFDALDRTYEYHLYNSKDPFKSDRAFFFPYKLDLDALNEVANGLKSFTDFTTFSKRNSQVKTFNCKLYESEWLNDNDGTRYRVRGDRFLRGMVRGLVGTMLKVGTGKMKKSDFYNVVESHDCSNADFSVPAHGLFLIKVNYSADIFEPI